MIEVKHLTKRYGSHTADDAALKEYGLDQPSAVLSVTHTETTQIATDLTDSDGNPMTDTVTEEKTFVLELGDTGAEGVYARLRGSSMVYLVTESYAYEIMNITLADLMSAEE